MSIEQLQQVVTPPLAPLERGTAAEWQTIEEQLGTALPADYKALVDAYGTGGFNDFLYVFNPFAGNQYRNLLQQKDMILAAYRTSQQQFPKDYPDPVFPAPNGLLPWAGTDNGDQFFWQTTGEPDTWPTLLFEARHSEVEHYDMPATALVAALLSGQQRSEIFPTPQEFGADRAPEFTSRA